VREINWQIGLRERDEVEKVDKKFDKKRRDQKEKETDLELMMIYDG